MIKENPSCRGMRVADFSYVIACSLGLTAKEEYAKIYIKNIKF